MVGNKSSIFNPFVISAVLCVFLFYMHILPTKKQTNFSSLLPKSQICVLEGTITSNPCKTSSSSFYLCYFSVFNAQTENNSFSSAKGRVSLLIPSEQIECFFPGKLYSARNKKEALFAECGTKLRAKGFFTNNGAFCAKECSIIKENESVFSFIIAFRGKCRLLFRKLMYSWGSAGGLLLALLSGIREYTEKDVANAFKNAGLSHILALSGMHLGLFSGFARFFSGKIKLKKISYIIELFTICLFVWFAGFSPSLFRAFICSIIALLIRILNLKKLSMTVILSVSFLLHGIFRPQELHELSFLLSYGALAGILFFSELVNFFSVKNMPYSFSSPLSASFGAQLFSTPVTLKILGTFAPLGILASVIVSPLITIFIYFGLLCIIICLIFPFFVPYSSFFIKILYNVIKKTVFLFAATS